MLRHDPAALFVGLQGGEADAVSMWDGLACVDDGFAAEEAWGGR